MACRARLERRRACLQPQGELMARKSKEIKANLLFFPFIYFGESVLFKELHEKK
jgi:hypothetical protein